MPRKTKAPLTVSRLNSQADLGRLLAPSLTLLCKLGSLLIHYEEATSTDGHAVDLAAIRQLRNDPEIVAWMATMRSETLLPLKRRDDQPEKKQP